MVAVVELKLELDAPEVAGRRLERQPVAAGLELLGQPSAPVGVGLGGCHDLLAAA